MAALTTIIAGVTAVASVAAVKSAKDTAGAQKAAQERQLAATNKELEAELNQRNLDAASRAKADEARREQDLLGTQDQGRKVADVELGTSKASDKLLKRTTKNTGSLSKSKGSKIGGLSKDSATKVGGL